LPFNFLKSSLLVLWRDAPATPVQQRFDVRNFPALKRCVPSEYFFFRWLQNTVETAQPAAVAYISPAQVNIQPPDDTAVGPVQVVVTTAAGGAGAPFTVNYAAFAPGLFTATAPYLAAQHADGSYVGGYAGATPAKPGEVITLWGTGFGPANPSVPSGQVFTGSSQLANTVNVAIGGQLATVEFAGVVGARLVQINVQVPPASTTGTPPSWPRWVACWLKSAGTWFRSTTRRWVMKYRFGLLLFECLLDCFETVFLCRFIASLDGEWDLQQESRDLSPFRCE
jgi:uncharacterized protein (TIGR03437 family)